MVPLFYFLGLGMSNAVGTSKFVITFISFVSMVSYLRSGRVNHRVGLPFRIHELIDTEVYRRFIHNDL